MFIYIFFFVYDKIIIGDRMKKVLIATTNRDKFKIVSYIFQETIFPKSEYEIVTFTDKMKVPEVEEEGTNKERARKKALTAYNYLEDYHFDYIVGLDDAVYLNGIIDYNVKKVMCKILFQDYLKDGEEYGFNRAYCIIDKNGKEYEFSIDTPYIYHKLKGDYKIEEHTYPLSKVSYPLNSDKPICDLTEEESNRYYLDYALPPINRFLEKKYW